MTLVDLSLFQNKRYAAGFGIIFFFGFGILATVYAFPIFGQLVQSFTPNKAGTLLLPASLVAAAMIPFTGRASDVTSHQALLFVGLAISSVSVLGPTDADSITHYWYIAAMLLITPIGSVIVTPPMMAAPLLGLPADQMQRGAGLANFAVNFGVANGAALYAVFLEQRIQNHASFLAATQTFDNDTTRELLYGASMLISRAGVSGLVRDGVTVWHLKEMIVAQATALGFQDGFVFIGISMMIPFIPLIFVSQKAETKP